MSVNIILKNHYMLVKYIYNFRGTCSQSRRHRGALVGLYPPSKVPRPPKL